jgi:hypothetical protein
LLCEARTRIYDRESVFVGVSQSLPTVLPIIPGLP